MLRHKSCGGEATIDPTYSKIDPESLAIVVGIKCNRCGSDLGILSDVVEEGEQNESHRVN